VERFGVQGEGSRGLRPIPRVTAGEKT
jgi:hypothetical protein